MLPGVGPAEVGCLKPSDLLGALMWFEARLTGGDG